MFIEPDPAELLRQREEHERELRRRKKEDNRTPEQISKALVLHVRSGEYRNAQKLLKNDFQILFKVFERQGAILPVSPRV